MGKKRRASKRRAVAIDKDHSQLTNMEQDDVFEEDLENKIESGHRRPKPGQCQKGICGKEAACLSHSNNTYSCICPHDKSPPTKDWRCTRITVPPTPHPIKNIRLSSDANSTISKSKNATSRVNNRITSTSAHSKEPLANAPGTFPSTIVISVLVGVIVIVMIAIIFTVISWRRRKQGCLCYNKNPCTPVSSPIVLKRSFLVPERYAPNPQYSACSSSSVPIIQRESLKFLNELGEGCFGKVFKGELQIESSYQVEVVAIKVLKESASREVEEDFFREVDIMSAFRHKHILSLVGVVIREGGFSPMMVFEYMPHGDLAELLREQTKCDTHLPILSKKDLMLIAMQISSGMSYLAAQRFVHRDLACRNCLVATGPIVKIADFGMSRDVYTCDYYKIGGSRLLPVRWMSPESVMYGRFTLESDIWSYGIILWEIYSYGKQPYYGHSNEEVVKLILQGIMLIPPEDSPTVICSLMKACWKTEPRDRIKFSEIFDKLYKVFHNYEQLNICITSKLSFQDEHVVDSATLQRKLPRPPPLLPLSPNEIELLDTDGYLLPNIIRDPVQYLDVQKE
ncbi:hypothetical protein PPYR_08934 [Photinus pyralis]|uniref:Protein kinase domain-containing protein n=2 Tax=Photinus pyralis TaxID=7054 RepID=A0A1Y1M813_PHOPY|nr:muscle, skeletal receptor tyrosine-protein kinase-like [Photinus pyralis]KAB0797941.1 hypothetical protein PPYR_08934 [Photinus pyralis]